MNNCECDKEKKDLIKSEPQVKSCPRVIPVVKIDETEEGYGVAVELPGVVESSINLTVEDRTLSLTAKNEVKVPDGYKVSSLELPDVEYHAMFELPERVDANGIRSKLADGVLYIMLPKKSELKPRKITVSVD